MDNFVIIYELLDEIMDHGYPQITEAKILKEYIKTDFYRLHLKNSKSSFDIAQTITNVVSWRPSNLYYKNNEVYLDVIEKINTLISSNGSVLRSEIMGVIKVKCNLSGMPILRLGLNDKIVFNVSGKANQSVEIDDFKFHQCVDMKKFDENKNIEFVPPDGNFELMTYRLDTQLKPLFSVEVHIDEKFSTKHIYTVKAKTNYKNKSIANSVDIFIPGPYDLLNPTFQLEYGKAQYNPENQNFQWSIKQFQGQTELVLKITFNLPTVREKDANSHLKIPILVKFDIPYFTVSGLQVRYLKIDDKSGYDASPWVRYLTQNGEFQIRMV